MPTTTTTTTTTTTAPEGRRYYLKRGKAGRTYVHDAWCGADDDRWTVETCHYRTDAMEFLTAEAARDYAASIDGSSVLRVVYHDPEPPRPQRTITDDEVAARVAARRAARKADR